VVTDAEFSNNRSNLTSKVTNFKIGLIIPVIMGNAKAEQSNIILELVMPDINTKSAEALKVKQILDKRPGEGVT
jgi:hypothetical protein